MVAIECAYCVSFKAYERYLDMALAANYHLYVWHISRRLRKKMPMMTVIDKMGLKTRPPNGYMLDL